MNNLRFGIEIETNIPALSPVSVGRYHGGNECDLLPASEDGKKWKAERDGSIVYGPGRQACEFVSPVLKGTAGLKNVVEAVAKIRELDAKVNSSCGIHVTVEWTGNQQALARLIHLVANFETAFYGVTGTKSRENGRYCKKIKQYGDAQSVQNVGRWDRYHILNLTHVAEGRNRVEFRCFSGSLNILKIVGWIQMCLAAVEVALDGRIRPFSHSTVETAEQAIKRFFATMKWIGINPETGRGSLYPQGYRTSEPTLPPRRSVRNELKKMAQKYDADSTPSRVNN